MRWVLVWDGAPVSMSHIKFSPQPLCNYLERVQNSCGAIFIAFTLLL